MKATLTLKNARIYGVTELMVTKEEKFELKLSQEHDTELLPPNLKWFSSNDPVLNIFADTDGRGAALESKEEGTSEILIMDENLQILKRIAVTVVSEIPVEAEVLEATAEVLEKETSLQ